MKHEFTLVLKGHETAVEHAYEGSDFPALADAALHRANFVSKPWFALMRKIPGQEAVKMWTFPTLEEFVAFRQGFEEARG